MKHLENSGTNCWHGGWWVWLVFLPPSKGKWDELVYSWFFMVMKFAHIRG